MYPYNVYNSNNLGGYFNVYGEYRVNSDLPPTKPPAELPYISYEANYKTMSSCIGRWTYLSFKHPSYVSAGLWVYIIDVNMLDFSGYVLKSDKYTKNNFDYSKIEYFMVYIL